MYQTKYKQALGSYNLVKEIRNEHTEKNES